MERCFDPDIFLPQLLDKFWKLTLQTISRLNVWIKTILDKNVPIDAEPSETTELKLRFLSYTYIDVTTFQSRLANGFAPDGLSYLRSEIPDVLHDKVLLSLREFVTVRFPEVLEAVRGMIVESVRKECSVHVVHVSQIPRLYRKTNRSVPNAASGYVMAMCCPIEDFKASYEARLGPDVTSLMMKSVYEKVTAEYRKLVENVLTSVAKTEESLRRLKKSRNVDSPESSDDQKIRTQVQLDVNSYAGKAGRFVDVTGLFALIKDATPPRDV